MKKSFLLYILVFCFFINIKSSVKEDFSNLEYRKIAYGSLLYLEYPITEVDNYQRPYAQGFFERVLDMRIRLQARLFIQKYNYKKINEEDIESEKNTDNYIISKIHSSQFYQKKFIDYLLELQNGDLYAFFKPVKSLEAKGENMHEIIKLKSIVDELEKIKSDDYLYPYIISFFSLNY